MAGFVPTQSTWSMWRDAGYPSTLANPITGTTGTAIATYKGCDGTSLVDVNLNLVFVQTSGQTSSITDYQGTRNFSWRSQSIKVVSDTILTSDLTVFVTPWKRTSQYGTTFNEDFVAYPSLFVTIPSGSTESNTLTVSTNDVYAAKYAGFNLLNTTDYLSTLVITEATFSLNPNQGTIPSCAPPPPTCDLEITGSTSTNPTFQGGTDGSLEVFISGGTAPVTYSLNNQTPVSSGSFTGLAAGTYTIFVEDDDGCYDQIQIILGDGEFRTGDFIVTEPSDFLASENPIITTLGTMVNPVVPANAVSTFTFDAGIENNYKVIFNLTSPSQYSATFTAKDFPNRETYFTTTVLNDSNGNAIGVNTIEEVADSFAEAIQKDINLNRWYYVSVTDNVVTLTAKEQRASMTLTSSNVEVLDETGTVATTGITLTNTVAGADAYQGSLVSDYSLYTDVYVGDGNLQYGDDLSGGTYNNYTTLELPFNIRDNVHQFDVSEIMKTFVFTPKVDLTFTGFTFVTSMLRPFYIRYGEKYPLVANTNTKKKRSKGDTGYKWVLNSALQWEDANDMSTYFTGGTFLTNAPNPLDIQRQQTNFLYFILPKNQGGDLTLKGDIDYYDGTSDTGITFITISTGGTNAGGVYALNVSYNSLGLAAYEASGNTKVKRCTFAIYSDATQYSEERSYRFEIDEQPRKFGVSFQNKLGAYDTFDFVGVVENTISRNSKNYTIPREIQSDGSSPEGFKNLATYDTKVVNQVIVNSGWIDEDHFDWLRELLESNNIYSYSEPNQNYLNVIGYTYKKSSLDDLYEIEVTFNHTIYNNNVTI